MHYGKRKIVAIATFVTRLQVIALDCYYRAIGEIGKGPGDRVWLRRPRRLRAWRERNDLSQSEAPLKLQISKRTLQEWEQHRAAPRGLARTAIEKAIRA